MSAPNETEPQDCPTPEYHETHRYCLSCIWTEDYGKPVVTDHERVQTALSKFDAMTPLEAQAHLGQKEHGLALVIFDTGEVDVMHSANRIAVAVSAWLDGKVLVDTRVFTDEP